jgi:hypothetical protein
MTDSWTCDTCGKTYPNHTDTCPHPVAKIKFDTFRKSSDNTEPPIPEAVKDEDDRWVTEFSTLKELLDLSAREDCAIEIQALRQKGLEPMDTLVLVDAADDD